jgi:2-amino-4-hydroxy-6-hydroxymethyldihydropteridine diphosphokinase
MQNLVFIGLGSNLGNRENNLRDAIGMILTDLHATNLIQSSIHETEPWGFESDNNFLNMCISIQTPFNAEACLERMKTIERKLGRTEKTAQLYVSRVIDLDILFFNNEIIETAQLSVPHPFLQQRLFVLQPLAELAPNYIHPLFKKSITQLLTECLR